MFDLAKRKGFDRVCIYNTGWNRFGFDSGYPTRLPPNPERGTYEDFRNAAEYGRSLSDGFIYSVHDNYIDCYKNSPEYSGEEMVHNKNGAPVKGGIWRGGRCTVMCSAVSLKYAARDFPEIARHDGARQYLYRCHGLCPASCLPASGTSAAPEGRSEVTQTAVCSCKKRIRFRRDGSRACRLLCRCG